MTKPGTFSRVFNISKPCLRLNVRFFHESSVLLATVAKNLGSKKTGTIDSAGDERNEVPAKTSYRKP